MAQQTLLTRWVRAAEPAPPRPPRTPPPRYAAALFADTPSLQAWTSRGYRPVRLAPVEDERHHTGAAVAEALRAHASDLAMVVAFPSCTDLSAAGARWWKRKRLANPDFQNEAAARVRAVEEALKATGVPYAVIVAAAPRLRKLWKAPAATISPHEYGGWLAAGEPHPSYPEVVPQQDAYVKRTYVYVGNGFVLPQRRLVIPKWAKRRRKGKLVRVSPLLVRRKHRHLRRLSPLGFLEGAAATNSARIGAR